MKIKIVGIGVAVLLLVSGVLVMNNREGIHSVQADAQIKNVQSSLSTPKSEVKSTTQSSNQKGTHQDIKATTSASTTKKQESHSPAKKNQKTIAKKPVSTNNKGPVVVTNASSVMVLVNKKRSLPASYEPADLVVPAIPFSFSGNSPKKQLRRTAARALEQLFNQAKRDKINLKAVSGYRSYATQKAIFSRNAKAKGEGVANRTSAYPGQSEHQTGLAMDVSSASVGYALEQSFGTTKEGKWLVKNAHKFGFIIRYPKGKESITGYSYEPWHIRYVGKDIAQDVASQNITLEEYFNEAVPVSGKRK